MQTSSLFRTLTRSVFGRLALINLTAAALYFLLWRTTVPPRNDARGYLHVARHLLDTGTVDSIERPPGYPAFIAFLFGVTGRDNYAAILTAQLILHAASALIIGLIVHEATRANWLPYASVLLLWTPALLSQTRFIYSEALAAFLATVSLFALLEANRRRSKLLLLLSSLSAGSLALTRPAYALLIPVWLLADTVLVRGLGVVVPFRLRQRLQYWVGPFVFVVLGWSARNYFQHRFFGVSAQLGFGLTTRTVTVLERLPERFAAERDILIRARDKLLLESNSGHDALNYWERALPELQKETGLPIAALAGRLTEINVHLIVRAPLTYVRTVTRSVAEFWLPSVDPNESIGGEAGRLLFSAMQLALQVMFLVSGCVLAAALILGRRAFRMSDDIRKGFWIYGQVAILGAYTAVISSAVGVGVPRYRVPIDPAILMGCVVMGEAVLKLRGAGSATQEVGVR